MRRFQLLVLAASVAAGLVAGSLQAWAQPLDASGKTGAVDKFKTKLLERYRAKLEVKDDAEWNIIQQRIEHVLQAQRELQSALLVSQLKKHSSEGKASKEGAKGSGQDNPVVVTDGSPEAEVRALQKLVATRAPAQQLKPQLARVRAMLQDKQEKLAKAREDLRVVLSARQEAIAVLNGLLR